MNRINDPTSTVDTAFVRVPIGQAGDTYGYQLTDAERAQLGLPVLWANPPFGGDSGPSQTAGDTETPAADGSPQANGKLAPHHQEMLAKRGISSEFAAVRDYETIENVFGLKALGLSTKICKREFVPGIAFQLRHVDGPSGRWTYRPDRPRMLDGKLAKYEMPWRQPIMIDVPPGMDGKIEDVANDLWVTEGTFKADCGAQRGLCIVALNGVWGWQKDGQALPDWRDIPLRGRRVILAFDSDVTRNPKVHKALREFAAWLKIKGAYVEYLHLPPDPDNIKVGLDDHLAAGHTVADLYGLVKPELPGEQVPGDADRQPPRPQPVQPVSLDAALDVFNSWLHMDDTAPVLVIAAAIVANLAEGDPVWLLLVGPPSSGKTEILLSCLRLPHNIVPAATFTEASLLSGTSKRERTEDATGGLMRTIGEFGILLAKDFTSVLSQNRDTAGRAMSALREIYDGRWDRPVGVDGARVLHWEGKCGFIGGVTPSYDRYGSIVNTLGDRFLLLRLPDVDAVAQARSALAQAEHEKEMRAALGEAMARLIASADLTTVHAPLSDAETARLIKLASFTATARTVVERDGYTGELLVIPQAEGPARLIKAMRRIYGALGCLGVDDTARWELLARIAADCGPAIRAPLMDALLGRDGWCRTAEIAEAAGLVTKTAARHLEDLVLLGIAERTKHKPTNAKPGAYTVVDGFADNSPDWWQATGWLRDHHWLTEVRQISTTTRVRGT